MSDDWDFGWRDWGSSWSTNDNAGSGGGSAAAVPDWQMPSGASSLAPANDQEATPRRDYFDLEGGVGYGAANRHEDVAKVETLLGEAGYYGLKEQEGPTGYFGPLLGESIKDYQADSELEIDGYLAPEGETIRSLKQDVGPRFFERRAPTAAEIEAHHAARARGESGLLHVVHEERIKARDDLPALPHALAGDATRTAQGGLATRGGGDLSSYLAKLIEEQRGTGSNGAEAAMTYAYVRQVLEELHAGNPATGFAVLGDTLDRLRPDERRGVFGGELPAPQPIGTFRAGALEAYTAEARAAAAQAAAEARLEASLTPAERAERQDAMFAQIRENREAHLRDTRARLGLALDGSEDHKASGLHSDLPEDQSAVSERKTGADAQRPASETDAGDTDEGVQQPVGHRTNDKPDEAEPAKDKPGGDEKGQGVRGDRDGIGGTGDPGRDSFMTPEFRAEIAKRESQDKGYETVGKDQTGKEVAWGKYQMTEDGLRDVGLKDRAGNWTGLSGIKSAEDFLRNPGLQEKYFEKYMANTERYVRNLGIPSLYGQEIEGLRGKIVVTEAGVMAAAHREGQGRVKEYLDYIKEKGWTSRSENQASGRLDNFDGVRDSVRQKFLAIETRLREFQNEAFRKPPGS